MKIIRNDGTGLEARQGNLGQIVFCSLFLAGGIWAIALMSSAHVAVGYVVGGMFILAGGFGVATARSTRILADKASSTVSINYRSLVSKNDVSINFADITRVTEESSVLGSNGSSNQVVEILTKDGTAIPIPVQRGGF